MRTGFYAKIAWSSIQKNRRLTVPYLLTGAVLVMMSYIISFLSSSEMLTHMKGGGVLRTLLPVGSVVIAIFSILFLFYSNSFLLRQRNREFGLYNILGMDKGNLGKIMFWEVLFSGAIAIGSGLIFGIAFSKLAELVMDNLLQEEIVYTLRIDFSSVGKTAFLYCGIYFLLLVNSLWKIHRLNPLELLHSDRAGDKPPKANWLWAVVGVLILAAAYWIALSIKAPLSAIIWFMIAVVLVVIATYLLFISGSVALCRLLQKNRRYYYKANHFISVSSMSYRMKRNGAGLASICILITMVLVMLSATLSMYIGAEDSLATQYPKDIAMNLFIPTKEAFNEATFDDMSQKLDALIPDRKNEVTFSAIDIPGLFTPEGMLVDASSHSEFSLSTYDNVGYLHIISLEDYNRVMDKRETLAEDECLLYCFRTAHSSSTFTIENCRTLNVKKTLDEMYVPTFISIQVVPVMILIVPDPGTLVMPIESMEEGFLERYWACDFDMDADGETILDAYSTINSHIGDLVVRTEDGGYSYSLTCKEEERAAFYGMYAGLFFLAILLSVVFLFAAVLIIYYKQISEGYEDQSRFQVMQKVGMTKRDIRKSINSQVLTVFFAPLLLAGVHLGFAFPVLWKLLILFNFSNITLMIGVTIACFSVFALVYAWVYKITSNAYYSIVSDGKGHIR